MSSGRAEYKEVPEAEVDADEARLADSAAPLVGDDEVADSGDALVGEEPQAAPTASGNGEQKFMDANDKTLAISETKRIVYLSLLMQSEKDKRQTEANASGRGFVQSMMMRGRARQQCTHIDLVMKVACHGPDNCEWRVLSQAEADRRAKAGKNSSRYLEEADHSRHHHFLCISVIDQGVMWYVDRVWIDDKDTSEAGTTVKNYRVFEVDVSEEQYQRLLLFCRAIRVRNPAYDFRSLDATVMASAGLLCRPEEGTWTASPFSCFKNTFCGCAWIATTATCKCVQGIKTMWCCAESRLRAWFHTRDLRDSATVTPEQLAAKLPAVEFCPSFIIHSFDFAGLDHLSSLDPLTSSPDEIAERMFSIANATPSKGIREVVFQQARKETVSILFNSDVKDYVHSFKSTGINDKIGSSKSQKK